MSASHDTARTRPGPVARHVDDELERWTAAGLIDATTARAIRTFEFQRRATRRRDPITTADSAAVPASPARRVPAVAEALGYIGAVLAAVGVVLLVRRSWADLSTIARLTIAGVRPRLWCSPAGTCPSPRIPPSPGCVALSGWRQRPRPVCSVGSSPTTCSASTTVRSPPRWWRSPVTSISVTLWRGRDRPMQQGTAIGGGLVAVGTLATALAGPTVGGVALLATGAAVATAGVLMVGTAPALSVGIGAFGALGGGLVVAGDRMGLGLVLATTTSAACVAMAVARGSVHGERQRAVLAVAGVAGSVQAMPQTVVWFADEAGVATGARCGWSASAIGAAGIRRLVLTPRLFEVLGGSSMLVGAAVVATGSIGLATLAGVATAIGCIAVGMLPGRVLMSVVGSVGLLAFVPWAIAHFFPGEGRAPLLIVVSGALIVAVAVLMAAQSTRWRDEVGGPLQR
ncbi:MAG: hypothetical protein R2713_03215 [Ilumatobacteraceae bacterium]